MPRRVPTILDLGPPDGRVAVLLLAALLSFAPAGLAPLYEPDEGRYAEIAREMVVSGDWSTPRFNGVEHLTKPPLAYWAAAAAQRALGASPWAARLPVALASVVTTLAVAGLGDLLGGRRVGTLAALVHATAVLPFLCGHFLSTDVFVTAWQAVAVWAAMAGLERGRPGLGLLSWAAFGMAFMTKGPPGLLAAIPLLVVLWRRPGRRHRGRVVLGLALFLATGFWWFGLMVLRDPARLRYFLVDETVQRVFSDHHGRENSRLLYLGALTLGTLPWTGVWRRVGSDLLRWWRTGRPRPDTATLLLATWILGPLAIFCLARSRLLLYVAPLFVPLSVLFARTCALGAGRRRLRLPLHPGFLAAWGLVLVLGWFAGQAATTGWEPSACARAVAKDAGGDARILNATDHGLGSVPFGVGGGLAPQRLDRDRILAASGAAERSRLGLRPDAEGHPTYLLVRVKDLRALPGAGLRCVFRGSRLAALRLAGAGSGEGRDAVHD